MNLNGFVNLVVSKIEYHKAILLSGTEDKMDEPARSILRAEHLVVIRELSSILKNCKSQPKPLDEDQDGMLEEVMNGIRSDKMNVIE